MTLNDEQIATLFEAYKIAHTNVGNNEVREQMLFKTLMRNPSPEQKSEISRWLGTLIDSQEEALAMHDTNMNLRKRNMAVTRDRMVEVHKVLMGIEVEGTRDARQS